MSGEDSSGAAQSLVAGSAKIKRYTEDDDAARRLR